MDNVVILKSRFWNVLGLHHTCLILLTMSTTRTCMILFPPRFVFSKFIVSNRNFCETFKRKIDTHKLYHELLWHDIHVDYRQSVLLKIILNKTNNFAYQFPVNKNYCAFNCTSEGGLEFLNECRFKEYMLYERSLYGCNSINLSTLASDIITAFVIII